MTHLDDDLSIPPEIEARLRSVDGVLPPTPAWHAPADEAGLLRVVPVRRASRGPSVAAVLVAVVLLVGGAVLIGRPSAPGPAASSPGTEASGVVPSGSTTDAPSMDPTEAPTPPAAGGPAIELLRGAGDGENLIVPRFGCDDGVGVDALTQMLYGGADVDRAAVAAGIESGWLEVPIEGRDPARVWLGEDVVGLAIGVGSPLVAVGERGLVWLTEGRRANQWIPLVTPAGRTAWSLGGTAVAVADTCPSASPGPAPVVGIRSFACGSIDHEACVAAIDDVRAEAPEAFTASADVTVATPCEPGPDRPCAFTWGGAGFIVVAAPAGWRSIDDLRAFATGGLGVGQIEPREIPAHVVALVARPSLPLPMSEAPTGGGIRVCMSARLEGGLRGSPWDPWIARVGRTAVRWPGGFTARFVPDLELVGPDGAVIAREGDLINLGGGFVVEESDRFAACSINGTTYPTR